VLLAVVLCALALTVDAQNPITGGPAAAQPEIYGGNTPEFIRTWSRTLQETIASMSRRVRAGDWAAGLGAFFVAVVFGMVHIAGPGHGKVFAISYFAGRDARPRDGIAYSAVVNAVDSLSAFLLVVLGYVLLRALLPSFRDDGPRVLQLFSYGAIVIFGVLHLISHLRGHADHAHDGHIGHDHGPDHEDRAPAGDPERRASRLPAWILALPVGLVPCPVSTILLVYGIANGVLPFMLFMVLGVSLGGFVVMAFVAVGIIAGRTRLVGRLRAGAAGRLAAVLEYAASGVIIVGGTVLFVAQL